MRKNCDPIDELRSYLTLQLEAHLKEDLDEYEELEAKIREIERRL